VKGKHVLITGHTGFKGSWLTAMLHVQGAKVSGIALDPEVGGIFDLANLHEILEHDIRQDIRDGDALAKSLQKISPDVVIHLAAQPLVLASYENPTETYETNVMGTLNVLQAVEATPSVQATLVITTDKVYLQNPAVNQAFVETDPLGAADPYSTSKAMADLLTQEWISRRPELKLAIARAGNVIGGGDVAANRLLPDLVNAFKNEQIAEGRNPTSVRPWQHVLDCLWGYLTLTRGLVEGTVNSGIFNFGPDAQLPLQVEMVAKIASENWGQGATWVSKRTEQPHESDYLTLDSSKSRSLLGWHEGLSQREAIIWAVSWYKQVSEGDLSRRVTLSQVNEFLQLQNLSNNQN